MDDPVMEFLADEGMGGGPPLDQGLLLDQVIEFPRQSTRIEKSTGLMSDERTNFIR